MSTQPTTQHPDGKRGAVWLTVRSLLAAVPLSLTLLAVLWALYAACRIGGVSPRDALGYDLPADPSLWHFFASGLTCWHLAAMVYFTVAILAFAAPAEKVLGTGRFAVVALASHCVAVPVGAVIGAAIERGGFNKWGADLVNEVYLSPAAWVFGALAVSTARMGVLWRRRLRLVLVALTGTLVLYSGTLTDVVALAAVLLGWAGGELANGVRRPNRHVSLRESRVLVASLFVAVGLGPVLTALSPNAQGPFAGVSQLMWEPAVAAHQVEHRCTDPGQLKCLEALAINQQHGVGPFLLNCVPLALTLILSLGLVRGRRMAWWGAGAMSFASLVVIAAEAATDASDVLASINIVLVVLPWAAVLCVLTATRARFAVPSRWQGAAARLGVALAATAAVWILGALALRGGFLFPPTLGGIIAELPSRCLPPAVAVLLPHAVFPHSAVTWALYEWVGIFFWAYALWQLYRVLTSAPSAQAESDRAAARALLQSGTGDHLAWMGLWDGNRYFFAPGADPARPAGYVAYRVANNVAVSVGSPVAGPATTTDEVAAAFEEFAASQGWRVAWYSVPQDFARPGFRTIRVAEESLLYTDNLEFKGKKFQNIRTARNRAAKEHVQAVWTSWQGCSVEMREKIAALSEQWVADKALPEMGFTLGGLDELRDPDTKLLLAVDGAGGTIDPGARLHAVTSWLPVYESGELVGYTLDFMRRDADGFRPAIEFLLAEAAVVAGEQGLGWVSLSGAPLARTDEPDSLIEVLLDKTGATIEPLYGFRSLAASKHKFHPSHTGWNLAYDDEIALPAIALAVVSCYLPNMRTADMAAVVREFLTRRQGVSARGRGAESSLSSVPTARP